MKRCGIIKESDQDSGVSGLIEYLLISGILMTVMIVLMLNINTVIMQDPADRLSFSAFIDIGNGVSTRIVEVYVLAPNEGTISTKFDIPNDVAGRSYQVDIQPSGVDENIVVSRGSINSRISLSGIGATLPAGGSTTGAGLNQITYNSSGAYT